MREAFQYAVLRVVPSLPRGECLNAGVVLFCRRRRFLAVRTALDEARLRALHPDFDPAGVRAQLAALEAVAAGEPGAGPIARLDQSDRFGWLVAPASTVVQPGPVHTGLCEDPEEALARLLGELVLAP